MRIMVAGINGFVGQHLSRELHRRGVEIVGLGQEPELTQHIKPLVKTYLSCNLSDQQAVQRIQFAGIDTIINLAGLANVGASFSNSEAYLSINVAVHTVLYDAVLKQKLSPRIIAISSGSVYDSNQPMPQTEESKLVDDDKTNPYTLSKKRMEAALQQYRNNGLECIIVRPFNHSGPGQLPGFLIPDLAEQIKISIKENIPIKVGNLKTKRDYSHVLDVVAAYADLALAASGTLHHGIYNICSGESHSGEEILEKMIGSFGQKPRHIEVEVDQKRLRSNDVMEIYGNAGRIRKDTGWQPVRTLDDVINDFVRWYLKQP